MKKTIFIAGYTGDIGQAMSQNLSGNYEIIEISGRDKVNNIRKIFQEKISDKNINILINCIGAGEYGMFIELSEKNYIRSLKSNILVPIKIFKEFIKINKKISEKNGEKLQAYIININSNASSEAFAQGSAYCSMKAALKIILQVIQKEYKKYGIKVKEFYPGVIKTKMLDKMPYIPKTEIIELKDFTKEVKGYIDNIN